MNSFPMTLPQHIIEVDPLEFREKYNRKPFQFTHHLSNHSLFELPRLVKLAECMLRSGHADQVTCSASQTLVTRKWSDLNLKEQVLESITQISQSGSWILLKGVQVDPEYNLLLRQILAELNELTDGFLQPEITWSDAYIFIASPQSVTPYHIDHELTFLFQIHGDRLANLFDPNDRSILREQEIEQYYIGNLESTTYHLEKQKKAYVYDLIPGTGVHHPGRAPHWFRNQSQYSVAMGIHLCMKTYDQQAKIYQANHYLRRFGLKPLPPGQSKLQDSVKIWALGLLSKQQPATKDELLRSGVRKLAAILSGVKQLARRFK